MWLGLIRPIIGRPVSLCLSLELTESVAHVALNCPDCVSVLAPKQPEFQLNREDSSRLGYCPGGGERRFVFPVKVARDVVFIGPRYTQYFRLVCGLWRKGARRIWFTGALSLQKPQPLFQAVLLAVMKILKGRLLLSGKLRKKLFTKILLENHQRILARRFRYVSTLLQAQNPCGGERGEVVFLGGGLGPGGTERQIVLTLSLLKKAGHSVRFLHANPLKPPQDFFLAELNRSTIPVHAVGSASRFPTDRDISLTNRIILENLGDLGAEVWPFFARLQEIRPKIIHAWHDEINVKGGIAALLAGVPKIFLSCRSLAPDHFAFHQPYMRPAYRFLAGFPNVTFLNNSQAGAEDYRRWLDLPWLDIRVIPNGLAPLTTDGMPGISRPPLRVRQIFGWAADDVVVCGVMRLSEEKRPLLWVDLAQALAECFPNAKFLVVGDGPLRNDAVLYGKKKLGPNIQFLGNQKEVMRILAASDALLLASRIEGTPNVLLEAQMVGIPVFAPSVGGIPESMLHGKTGWAFKTNRPTANAKIMAQLLTNKKWRSRAKEEGPRFSTKKFNPDRLLGSLLCLYGEMEKNVCD